MFYLQTIKIVDADENTDNTWIQQHYSIGRQTLNSNVLHTQSKCNFGPNKLILITNSLS